MIHLPAFIPPGVARVHRRFSSVAGLAALAPVAIIAPPVEAAA